MTKEQAKAIFFRFLRGTVAGAVSSMVTIMGSGVKAGGIATLADLQTWMYSLMFAGLVGGISGLILGIDKWARME